MTWFSSSNTPGTLSSFKPSLSWSSSAKAFKHRLNPQSSKVHKHVKLILMHALKLTLKCVTILSPLDFKRPGVQVFSERQLISFNKKKKKKKIILPWYFRSCKSQNSFHLTIAPPHIRIKNIALMLLATIFFFFHLIKRVPYWKL